MKRVNILLCELSTMKKFYKSFSHEVIKKQDKIIIII
jgi:hypothetical protein